MKCRKRKFAGKRWRLSFLAAAVMGLLVGPSAFGDGRGSLGAKAGEGEAKINVNFRRAPLKRVLEYLSRVSGKVNIKLSAADEEEREELENMLVTVELANVTWRTALDYLGKQYRLILNTKSEADGIIYLDRPPRVTLDVANAPIQTVIKLIAADANVSIILAPEVTGNVNININDIPWEDALDGILKNYGYIKVVEPSGIIRITTPERVQAQLEIRAIRLKYIQPGGALYRASFTAGGAAAALISKVGGAESGGPLDQSLVAVLNTIKSADGRITYESHTNMLILKDTAQRIQEMVKLIEEIDKAPRQVKIQTRIIEQIIQPRKRTGTRWGNRGLTAEVTRGAEWAIAWPFSANMNQRENRLGSFGKLAPPFDAINVGRTGPVPLQETATSSVWPPTLMVDGKPADYAVGSLSFEQLHFFLEFVESRTDTEIIQAPEIIALDNQEATVFIGTTWTFANIRVETTDGGTSTSITEKEVLAGVQLMVVPHICGDTDNIIIEVVPIVQGKPTTQIITAVGITLKMPESTESKIAHTRMMLKSGETGVIAGLMRRAKQTKINKIPWLGDIPVIRHLFRHRDLTELNETRNTTILITPTIISERHGDDFQDVLTVVRDQADALIGGVATGGERADAEEADLR